MITRVVISLGDPVGFDESGVTLCQLVVSVERDNGPGRILTGSFSYPTGLTPTQRRSTLNQTARSLVQGFFDPMPTISPTLIVDYLGV